MGIPLFTPQTASTVFSNTVAGAIGNKAVETTKGLLEPLNRESVRTDLRRSIETLQFDEYRQRERVKAAAKQIPQHQALAKSPPTSHHQPSWWSSHADRVQLLTETKIRAEDREEKVAKFSQEVSYLQQQCEKEQQACARRREAAEKALNHENSSTSGWTGRFWW